VSAATFDTIIALPRSAVWEKLRDLRSARHYVAGVTAIDMSTSQHEGVGASRKVFKDGRPPVDETVVAWEEGSRIVLKIHQGDRPPSPFKSAQFQYSLSDAPNGKTLVRGTFSYEMPAGILSKLLEVLILRRALARSHARVAADMKTFYETGRATNQAAGP
jgi:hypothetical protein